MDTPGLIWAVHVHAANKGDTMEGCALADLVMENAPTVRAWCADAGCRGTFVDDVEKEKKLPVHIRERIQDGFALLRRRWVVERTFSWGNGQRRLSRDCEPPFRGHGPHQPSPRISELWRFIQTDSQGQGVLIVTPSVPSAALAAPENASAAPAGPFAGAPGISTAPAGGNSALRRIAAGPAALLPEAPGITAAPAAEVPALLGASAVPGGPLPGSPELLAAPAAGFPGPGVPAAAPAAAVFRVF